MVEIIITSELVEWVQERLDTDADEAQNFAEEFAGMLYFSGAFAGQEANARLVAAAPLLLAALEMVQRHKRRGRAVVFSGEEWTQIDTAIAAARGEATK